MTKKILALTLSIVMVFSVFMVPVSACIKTETINIENTLNLCLDVLIHRILTVLNVFWPGYDGDWEQIEDYETSNFYEGEKEFDKNTKDDSAWYLGYAGASLLEGLDI